MNEEDSRLDRAVRWLDVQAARRGFLLKVGLFPLLDYALPFLPNQMLLIVLALLKQSLWFWLALTFAAASAAGALLVAMLVQFVGGSVADWLVGNIDGADSAFALIEQYGLFGLAGLALLPWPPRTGVMLCAVAGLPPVQIMLAVAGGRIVPATGIAFLAARSPLALRRLPGVGQQLARLGIGRP